MTSPKRQTCLHIGLPKTATKTLQMAMFAQHPEVHYLGIYSGKAGDEHIRSAVPGVAVKDERVEILLDQLLWSGKFDPDLERCRELYDVSVGWALKEDLVPIWSWESMVEDRHEVQQIRARNMKAIFGDCKVLVAIRHPLDLVESLYLQLLYRDNVGGRASARVGLTYESIDAWLERHWDTPGEPPRAHLEYPEAIEIFADTFGPEAVRVVIFEALKEDPPAFLREVCDFVGIDSEIGLELAKQRQLNTRWRQTELDEFLRIRTSPLRNLRFRFASRKARKRMLGMPMGRENPVGQGAKVTLSESWKERILDKTRAGNRRLAETWNLPLERYGYPL